MKDTPGKKVTIVTEPLNWLHIQGRSDGLLLVSMSSQERHELPSSKSL